MNTHMKNHQAGFTLIEIIVAIVVAAVMASMFASYFGTALTQSSVPITRLQKTLELHQVMENIVTDYKRLNKINLRYKWRSGHAYQLGDIVLPSDDTNNADSVIENNARYYVCTVAGTSGNTLPPWQDWAIDTKTDTTLGRTVIDGPVTWTEKGYVWKEETQYPANSIIVPEKNNGHFYQGGGIKSGTTEPGGTTSGGTENDDLITWTEVGTILESNNNFLTDNLWTLLPINTTPDRYGERYTVLEKVFISLDAGTSLESLAYTEKNLLKVTIQSNDTNETLTQFFTIY
jgi:prepilin-type N-terminal cleavage/methylation domain-containing protein